MHLQLSRWTSPHFQLLIVTDKDGVLRALEFAENEDRLRGLLKTQYSNYTLLECKPLTPITNAPTAYFGGDIDALNKIPTATNGTAFQREVWRALREIPGGTTRTYGQLAAKLGRPAASRAVGAANGANPIPIIVPCHRVIGANGSLTGFGSGLPIKKWLLEHESRHAGVASKESLL